MESSKMKRRFFGMVSHGRRELLGYSHFIIHIVLANVIQNARQLGGIAIVDQIYVHVVGLGCRVAYFSTFG
jgi:hypothetical protein